MLEAALVVIGATILKLAANNAKLAAENKAERKEISRKRVLRYSESARKASTSFASDRWDATPTSDMVAYTEAADRVAANLSKLYND